MYKNNIINDLNVLFYLLIKNDRWISKLIINKMIKYKIKKYLS